MVGDEHCLLLISLFDMDIIVSLSKVDLGEEFCSLYPGD